MSGSSDARPERPVQRLDEADRVAVTVDDREVDRAATRRVRGTGRAGGAARVDPRGQLGGVRRIEQARDRDVATVWVGQVRVAIGHRQLGRLDPGVDPAGVGHPVRAERSRAGRLELGEDGQDLEGDDPGAVGRMGRDPDASVVDRDRIGPGRGVVAQVVDRDRAAGGIQPACPARAEVATVERLEPARGDRLERRRQRAGCGRARPAARAGRTAGTRAGTAASLPIVDAISGAVRSTTSTKRVDAGKPSAASWMAGARRSAVGSRPNRAWASAQERTAPGTVMASGPRSGIVSWPARRRAAASAAGRCPARPVERRPGDRPPRPRSARTHRRQGRSCGA